MLLIALLLTAQATYRANQAIAAQRAATACTIITLSPPHNLLFRTLTLSNLEGDISIVVRMSSTRPHSGKGVVIGDDIRLSVCLLTPLITSSQPLMLLLAVDRLRSANLNRLTVPRCRLNTYGCRAFYHAGPTVWNSLPDEIRNSDSFDGFKRFLKTVNSLQPSLV